MPGTALILILLSTVLHASWNLLIRGMREEELLIRRMFLLIAIVGLVPMVVAEVLCAPFPWQVWVCAGVTGVFSSLYFLGLTKAYRRADFVMAYPMIRALPVLMLGAADVIRGEYPSTAGWAGMGLVALGCTVSPLRRFRELSVKHYFNRGTMWLLLGAGGTVGYTLTDNFAAARVPPGAASAARYGYLFFAVATPIYVLLTRLIGDSPPRRARVGEAGPRNGASARRAGGRRWRWVAVAVALGSYGSYFLVLWAYQLTDKLGYLVSFRQFSIVLGVVAGVALFKEGGARMRMLAAGMICAGLVIMKLWG